MSNNFTGVTFPWQKVAPSDDAIIRRAILADGILTGCELSYSGSTLTMAAGQLLACGRQIKHPAAQNWAVVDATSGYARLLLTIDLTRTSTKDVFDQVIDTIEYASSEDGFPDLEQADINGAGTRYQIAVCVVSLGTGGISGIVSQLEKCAADGSGGINFKLVGGTTQPSGPSENTIWVNTSTEINGYAFSVDAPADPVEGMVWIKTGAASRVAFNLLKKNVIFVYPMSAYQYIGGEWVMVTAKTYQDGAWQDWITYAFYRGDTCDGLTGGWVAVARNTNINAITPTLTISGGVMTVTSYRASSLNYFGGTVQTVEKIDMSAFTVAKFSVTDAVDTSDGGKLRIGVADTTEGNYDMNAYLDITEAGDYEVDISDVDAPCVIAINPRSAGGAGTTASISVDEIILE